MHSNDQAALQSSDRLKITPELIQPARDWEGIDHNNSIDYD